MERARQLPLQASGIQHALQLLVSKPAAFLRPYCFEARLPARAHPAGACHAAGRKPREQRCGRAAARFTRGGDHRFHTRRAAHAGDLRVDHRHHGRGAALGALQVDQIKRHQIPQLSPFRLRKHSSRRGWRVVPSSLAHDPFRADPNAPIWKLRDGRTASLREIATETTRPFRREIRRLSDLATLRHVEAVFAGDARSLLDFPKRPNAYDDAGHEINWNRRRVRHWPRSQYENVIHRVIAHEPIRIGRKRYRAERMQGWYEVAFREIKTGARRILNLDELVRLSVQQR